MINFVDTLNMELFPLQWSIETNQIIKYFNENIFICVGYFFRISLEIFSKPTRFGHWQWLGEWFSTLVIFSEWLVHIMSWYNIVWRINLQSYSKKSKMNGSKKKNSVIFWQRCFGVIPVRTSWQNFQGNL